MKILIIGDQHFRYELPYASSFDDGRVSEWVFVKKTILDLSSECDEVVLLGDGFNARHNHSTVIREFVDFLNALGGKQIHIIAGNHERYGESTALDFLKSISVPNWHIYTEPTNEAFIGGGRAMVVPYMTPALLGVGDNAAGQNELVKAFRQAPLAFMHHAITGTKNVEFFNEIVLDADIVSSFFEMTFAGHVHRAEKPRPNIQVTGNIFTQEVGEEKKYVYIWDTEEKKSAEIPIPCRGIYKVIWETEKERSDIPKFSIVKCYVTNRETDLEDVREWLKQFDSSVIVEQYPSEREKAHFEDGSFDLSVESLLKIYSETKKVDYASLMAGYELIKN